MSVRYHEILPRYVSKITNALTAAVKATADPSEGRPKQKLNVTANHTGYPLLDSYVPVTTETDAPVRIGDLKRVSTLCQNLDPGIAPSRENAYIMREFEVTENVPHKNIETMMITYGFTMKDIIFTFIDCKTYHERNSAVGADGIEENLGNGLPG